MFARRPLLLFALTLLAAPCPAQDLIGKLNERMADQPDAKALLQESAAAFAASPASFSLVNSVEVIAGERENTSQQVYAVTLGAPGQYVVEMVKPQAEFWVRSDGAQTMTYVMPLQQYSLGSDDSGVVGFAGSQLASMLGNGFGSLVFSLLAPESTATVVETLTEAQFLGSEGEGDAALLRCRYTAGDMTWDVWFTAGDSPRMVRLRPDLAKMAARAPAAQQFDNFSFTMTFDVKDYDADTPLGEDVFALTPPEGAKQVKNALSPPEPPPHELLGQKAPLFDSNDPAGAPIDLGGLVGEKIIILDFWATWCGPCVAAMPKLDAVAREYADRGVVLYAVNQGESAEDVTAFLDAKKLEVSVAMDPDSAAGRAYSIEGLPTSIVIGKDGRVQVVHVGFAPNLDDVLRGELDALLAGQDLAAKTIAEWNEANPDRPIQADEPAQAN